MPASCGLSHLRGFSVVRNLPFSEPVAGHFSVRTFRSTHFPIPAGEKADGVRHRATAKEQRPDLV